MRHGPVVAATIVVLGWGCGGAIPQSRFGETSEAERAAPLGPGYVLLPLGTDDDALLGQILTTAPAPGQAFEELAGPNPCGDKLAPASNVGMVSTLEDAQELKASVAGRAALGVFGFQAQAAHATHFVYKFATEKKTSRIADSAYLACCKEKACGYGVVTELVYGDGDYSAAEETSGGAGVDVVNIAGVHGTASLKILHKRHVHGWIAAKVMLHPRPEAIAQKPEPLPSPLGPATITLDVDSESAQEKELYDREKLAICPVDDSWAFCDARDKLDEARVAHQYHDLLGTNDLDDLEARRNTGWLIADAVAMVGGVALGAYGIHQAETAPQGAGGTPANVTPGLAMFGVGAGVAAVGMVSFLVLHLHSSPSVTNHKLTRPDAERIAERYNHTLLRKVTSDVEGSRWDLKPTSWAPVRIGPSFGLGNVGIVGSF